MALAPLIVPVIAFLSPQNPIETRLGQPHRRLGARAIELALEQLQLDRVLGR